MSQNTVKRIPKTAIIGASGFMGKFFLSSYRRIYADCAGTARCLVDRDVDIFMLDLLKPDISPLRLSKTGHKEALILAAATDIGTCESNKVDTRKVNVDGALELIRQLAEEGIKPVFFSTDQVFDGKEGNYSEDSLVNPITEYGRQKAEIEIKIKAATRGNFLVVRLSKVFSLNKDDGTLFDEMARILYSGGSIKAAFDQLFCPMFINDVISAVSWLQVKRATGIINVCPPEVWSRYNLAIALAKKMGIKSSNVHKVSLDQIMINPKYPKNTSMVSNILPRDYMAFTSINKCIEQVALKWMVSK